MDGIDQTRGGGVGDLRIKRIHLHVNPPNSQRPLVERRLQTLDLKVIQDQFRLLSLHINVEAVTQ